MSYVDLAWPWGLVTLGLQPLLSPGQDQVKPRDGPCGDQRCQQIVFFFGYLSRMTSFHHNSKNVDISRQLNNENQGWLDRRTLVAAAYTFAGFRSQCSSDCRWSRAAQYIMGTFSHRIYASSHRMGLGAVLLLVKGHLNEEMPRYLYQRLRHGLPIHYPKYFFLSTYLCP